MASVLGIHGIAQQQRSRPQLVSLWSDAYRGGVEIAGGRDVAVPPLDLAFYGDLFLSDADQGAPATKGPGRGIDPLADLTGEDVEFLDEVCAALLLDRPPLGAPMAGVPRVPKVLQPLARQLTRRFNANVAILALGALRQVKVYLTDDDLAQDIRARVLKSITPSTSVIVGHSLGSVVAVDVLALNPSIQVEALITVGSPLGMRSVTTRLRRLRAADPTDLVNARRWVNIFDPGDPVAVAAGLKRLWPGVLDFTVNNQSEPHAIDRYLAKRVTGREILAATGG